MAVDGLGVAYTATGFVLLWSGYRNTSIKTTLTSFLKGAIPTPNPTGSPTVGLSAASAALGSLAAGQGSTGASAPASTVTTIQSYAVAQLVAGTYGWATGAEWSALTSVINRESGGDPNARNASSGAYGIAQALGHGTSATAGTVANEYGNYGVPNSTAKAANSGNASAQLVWMMAYIKATYGDPKAAWNSELTRGYY